MHTSTIPNIIYKELLLPNSAEPIERIQGGLSSSIVLRCTLPTGHACLRCWPPSTGWPPNTGSSSARGGSTTSLLAIREAIEIATACGVDFLPKFFTDRKLATFVHDGERTWELTQWMPGTADYLERPSMARLKAALVALGRLHYVWSKTSKIAASPAVLQRLKILSGLLSSQNTMVDWLSSNCDNTERELTRRTIDCVHRYGPGLLQQVLQLAAEPIKLHFAIRDIWSDHVLFTDDQVTGIIDFGALRIDEPATDVARLLGSLEPTSRQNWQRGLEYYRELNGSIDANRVLALDHVSCLLSAVQWTKWLVVERRQFNTRSELLLARWRGFLNRLQEFDWRH